MAWTAKLQSIGAENTVLIARVLFESDTKEQQIRELRNSLMTMNDIVGWANQVISELGKRDVLVAGFQDINDALAAGKELVVAQSQSLPTAADATVAAAIGISGVKGG